MHRVLLGRAGTPDALERPRCGDGAIRSGYRRRARRILDRVRQHLRAVREPRIDYAGVHDSPHERIRDHHRLAVHDDRERIQHHRGRPHVERGCGRSHFEHRSGRHQHFERWMTTAYRYGP
jgi:hypothetical protein